MVVRLGLQGVTLLGKAWTYVEKGEQSKAVPLLMVNAGSIPPGSQCILRQRKEYIYGGVGGRRLAHLSA